MSIRSFIYYSSFFLKNSLFIFQEMVRMKTLELRYEDYEDQVVSLQKHLKNNNKVIKELQEFISPLTEKVLHWRPR